METLANFEHAVRLGTADEITETDRGAAEAVVTFPSSANPRGLAMTSLRVTENADGFWGWLRGRQQVYFLTVAFDLSGEKPVVMPPKELPEGVIHQVRKGEEIRFTLGEGAPIFFPRTIVGGLVVYILICEADGGVRKVGEIMNQVHADLTADDGSILDTLKELIKNPGKTLADEVLSAASAALKPVASILKAQDDDFIGLAQGIYKANGSWDGQLEQNWSGGELRLREMTP